MAKTEEHLREYFRAVDTKGTGKIGPEELRDLCANLGIERREADAIFDDLDCDKDGEINLDDFIRGFRKETNNLQKNNYSASSKIPERRTSDVKLAWSHLIQGIGEPVVHKVLNNSEKELKEFFHKLVTTPGCSSELVTQFEKTFSLVLQDMKHLHDDKQKVEQKYYRQNEIHHERLKDLEEELDAQVAKIEAEVKKEARLKYEQEKMKMLQKFEEERAEFDAQLKLYQKYNAILTKKKEENSNLQQKHAAAFENEKFDSILSDSTANLALFHSELARFKAEQQEARCREVNCQQEAAIYYDEQIKHISRKIALIEEANRNLQDTNDNLLAVMETKLSRISPSRAGSDSDILERDNFEPSGLVANQSIQNNLLIEQTHQSGAQYVIQRLMEDIDSGHSTLRDPIECDYDHKSIHEEFSDAESQLKSLESDDSKTSRRRTNKSEYVCMTPNSMMSFETTGDPDRTYKVVFAGDAAVGKSCFIHRFCKGNFATKLGSTLGVDFQIKTIRVDEKNIALQLWDTAGQERFRSMTKTYFRRADGVVLVYDVTSERSFLNIRQWIQSINESADKEIPILICGNKVDLREEARHLGANCVETVHGETLAKDYNALFFETSSKTGKHIFDALIAISREMLLKEDVEVQTSSLQVSNVHKPLLSCC